MKKDSNDAARYDSAIGWEPFDEYAELRDRVRRTDPALYPSPFESFDPALMPPPRNPSPLFGDLWRQGEIAFLVGETGVGKSILAVQIAEMIARSIDLFASPNSPRPQSHKVLYLDLDRTGARFIQRYSAPRPSSRRLVRYRFSPKFRRVQLGLDIDIPPAFNNDLDRYLRCSVGHLIASAGCSAVVIDSLATLVPTATGNVAATRLMRLLRAWAEDYGVSILLTAHAKKRSRPAPLRLSDIDAGRRIADLADSVFALGSSTMTADIRYLKHLKCLDAPLAFDHENVGVLALKHMARPGQPHHPAAAPASQLPVAPSSLIPSEPTPFLGFEFLGICDESDHLHNYEKEARYIHLRTVGEPPHPKLLPNPKLPRRPNRSALRTLTEGILDGSYHRYLNK